MVKVTKLEAGCRQLRAAVRMFFDNEDVLAVHTLSRAAFRVLFDLTKEGEQKTALEAHIKKVGEKRFNEVTNFLKHADRDPDGEIDDNFELSTEAAIGMAAALCVYHTKELTPEVKAFQLWARMMRPQYFDLPDQLSKELNEWRAASKTDPDNIKTQANSRLFGKNLIHWIRLRESKLHQTKGQAEAT